LATANGMDSGVVMAEGTGKGIQEMCVGRLGFGRKDPAVASSGINDEQIADIALATGNLGARSARVLSTVQRLDRPPINPKSMWIIWPGFNRILWMSEELRYRRD
jgi:hypothetical protein